MKRAILGLAVAALVVAPSTSEAQRGRAAASAKPLTWSLGVGASMPNGDFADAAKTGVNLQGAVVKALNNSPVWLRGEAAYHRFGAIEQTETLMGTSYSYSGRASAMSLIGDVGYSFQSSSSVKPYVLGGLGMNRASYSVETEVNGQKDSATESSNELGINFGGGLRFRMAGRIALVEARYMTIDDADFIPLTFSIEF